MKKSDWIVRDYLAAERTDLAIDRTLLAYIRTAMTIVVVGISLIKLFQEKYIQQIGFILVILAIGLIIIGFFRTKKQKEKLKEDFI
ncbi:MAG: DUF202 domain-containing protein [Patescibacteria group bacterium]